MAELFDFSWGRPGPAAIKSSGRIGVIRYLYSPGKGATKAELQSYLNAGLVVVLNYEGSGTDATSYINGVADARYAQRQAAVLGFPNAVIYFSIDEKTAPDPQDYFRGVESIIGHSRAGVYGGYGTITALQKAGLCSWFWQTYAWSGGRVAAGVHLYQYSNGHTINGASVDYDRNLEADFGQIGGPQLASTTVSTAIGWNASSWSTVQIQKALNEAAGAKLTVDGIYGPATTAAVHAFEMGHKLTVDVGIAGAQVVKELAALLTPPVRVTAPRKLAVDGKEGPLTCEAEQRVLDVTVDGVRGPITISAEQRRTGAAVDGIDGPDTNRHLQRRLNGVIGARLAIDGIRGPLTVKALQRALNAGKF